MWQVDCRGKGMTRARDRPRSVRRMRVAITARSRPGEGRWCVNGGRGAIPAAASESAQANSAGLANGIQSDDGVYS